MKKKLYLGILLSVIFALTANPQTGHVESSGLMKLRQQTYPEIFKNERAASSAQQTYKNRFSLREDFGDAPETDFMKKFGGSGKDEVKKVVADDAGNIYAVMDFSGEMEFAGNTFTSTGKRDVIIMKVDGDGNIVWFMQGDSGSENTAVLNDICLVSNSLYVTGYFDGAEFSMDGNTLTRMGQEDALLIRLSDEGNINLIKNFGAAGSMYHGTAVAVSEDNFIYLCGSMDYEIFGQPSFLTKLDAGGNQIWWQEHEISFSDLAITEEYLYVSGAAYTEAWLDDIVLTPLVYSDAFVAQANTDGSYNWAVIGEHVQSPFGDSWDPQIAVGSNGDVYMSGFFRSNVEFGEYQLNGTIEPFIVRISNLGEVVWAKSPESTGYELDAFTLLENDMACISGRLSGVASFDDISIGNPGSDNFYLAIYDSNGQATAAFLADNPGSGLCNLPGQYVLQAGTNGQFAFISTYDYDGAVFNQIHGSGNSGTSKLTGLETDGNDIIYALNNIHGYADFYGTELLFDEQTMVLSAQATDGALMWYETIEGGESWWNFTETTLKLDINKNNLLLHGEFDDTLKIGNQVFPGGFKQSFFASYTTDGELNWVKIIPYSVNVQSVDVDMDGNAYFVFSFSGTIDFEGQTFTSNSDGDALLLKFAENGTSLSANQIKTDVFFYQVGLATIPSGGYYLTVEPAGDTVFFNDGANNLVLTPNDGRCVVARYNDQHDFVWAKSFGYSPTNYGGFFCWPTASVTDADGNLYLTGTHADSAMFDDIMIRTPDNRYSPFNAKIDADGNAIWANSIQSHRWGSNYCEAEIDNEGNFYVMGEIRDTIHFGQWEYIPAGPVDMYVARYDNDGAINWVKSFESTSSGNHMYGMAVYEPDNLFIGGNFTNRIFQGDMSLYTSSSTTGNLVHFGDTLIPSGIHTTSHRAVHIEIFPNPANDFIYLQFDDITGNASIEIMDMQGRRIKEIELVSPPPGLLKVDVRHLPVGSYLISIYSNGESSTKKFILK